jgi:hypothetical protein
MKRPLLGFGAFFLVVTIISTLVISVPLAQAPDVGLARNIIIKDVNIVDVQNGEIIPNQDVMIQDGRLSSIEATSTKAHAAQLHVVDGRGKYLSPGLWDMHTHSFKTSPQFHHPLLIANGVLGVRDMSGCLSEDDSFWACIKDRKSWNRATDSKAGLSPRYVLQSSYQTNGGNEVPDVFPEFFKANEVANIGQLVTFYKKAGADFIKTYSELSPSAFKALAQEAEAQGLGIAGHLPLKVSLSDAIAAKQQTIEHPRLFLMECYNGRDRFRALPNPQSAYTTDFKAQLIDDHDAGHCKKMFQQMARSNTFWTPTLQVLKLGAKASDRSFREDARLRYIPSVINSGIWQGDADQLAKRASTRQGRNVDVEMYALAMKNLSDAHGAGVKILVGTDTGDSYIFPGFAVHDEMAEFVTAGLSPQDVLRMATIDAAKFSGVDDKLGSIEVGKAADMILLTANPYDDIGNTQKIDGVFYNGQYLDRRALNRLLDFAEQQAGSVRLNIRLIWDALTSPLMRVQLAD